MAIRIMLVDDEDMELTGLYTMLTQLDLPIEIVAQAWNGKQATELALQTRPDVIISDVRMPIMGGIEFIGAVRPELPDVFVVMISGHEDFDAIRNALNLGVDAWLVKPVDRAELIRLIRARFDAHKAAPPAPINAETPPSAASRAAETAVRQLLIGVDDARERAQLSRTAELFPGLYVTLVTSPADRTALLKEIPLRDFTADEYAVGPFLMPDGNITALLTYSGAMSEALLMERVEQVAEAWKDRLSAAYGSTFSVGVSLTGSEPENLFRLYRQAIEALSDQTIYGRGKVIFFSRANDQPEFSLETPLAEVLRTGDAEQLLAWLDSEMHRIARSRDLSQARAACIRILHELSVESASNAKWALFTGALSEEYLQQILRAETLPELVESMGARVDQWKALLKSSRMDRNRQIVDQIAGIVADNLNGDLSSEAISERVYLTTSHIRRVVKNVLGITLQEYVLKMRMQRARELLADPGLKVSDVAARVGYDSVSYFGLVFRKFYGDTPGEYKKQIR